MSRSGDTDAAAVGDAWARSGLGASPPTVSIRPHGSGPWLRPAGPAPDAVARVPPPFPRSARLAIGGMSEVWLARQESLRRDIALKIARDALPARERADFNAEAVCTAWLEHPNIVPVYEAGDGFIAMKRVEGDTLETVLQRGGVRMPEIVDVLIKVCDAVSFAHSRGIIHRDIKPDNILVGRFGEVTLLDWGLALQVALPADGVARAPLKGSRASLCAGTPGYLPPEVARADAEAIGPATDVFLLGATLYRVLADRLPFDADDALTALQLSAANDWLPLAQLGVVAHPRLTALQERAMTLEPGERPSVAAFQIALREWLRSCNAEVEAERCFQRSRGLLEMARAAGRRSDEAYASFSEALHYLDRALTLCPDRLDFEEIRSQALRDFAWSAVSAGEPSLARLLRRSDRLPSLKAGGAPAANGDAEAQRDLRQSEERLRGHCTALEGRLEAAEGRLAGLTRSRRRWRQLGLCAVLVPLAVLALHACLRS